VSNVQPGQRMSAIAASPQAEFGLGPVRGHLIDGSFPVSITRSSATSLFSRGVPASAHARGGPVWHDRLHGDGGTREAEIVAGSTRPT